VWIGVKRHRFLTEAMREFELRPEGAPLAQKFLEGMPEWLQHDNAYTGGYLNEDDVVALLSALDPKRHDLEASLKAGPLMPGWLEALARAKAANVGLTWTVPMLR
jgi:hypothetical protein